MSGSKASDCFIQNYYFLESENEVFTKILVYNVSFLETANKSGGGGSVGGAKVREQRPVQLDKEERLNI